MFAHVLRRPCDLTMVLLCLGLGCAEPAELEFRTRTRFFEVLVYSDAVLPCTGDYDAIDRIVTSLRGEFEMPLPTGRADLHLWSFGDDGFPCSTWAAGCFITPPGELHVRAVSSLYHEVAHYALATDYEGFFSEGLAEAHSARILPMPNPGFDPRTRFDLTGQNLSRFEAAIFTNFMIERFGATTTRSAFEGAMRDGVGSGFSKATGMSVDAIAEAFMAEPLVCSTQTFWCAGEADTFVDTWQFEDTLACSEALTRGVSGDTYTLRLLDVSSEVEALVSVEHGSITVERCAPCSERDAWFLSSDQASPTTVVLRPGRYVLSMVPQAGFSYAATMDAI